MWAALQKLGLAQSLFWEGDDAKGLTQLAHACMWELGERGKTQGVHRTQQRPPRESRQDQRLDQCQGNGEDGWAHMFWETMMV